MGKQARLKAMRREFKTLARASPAPTIETTIDRWIQIGSPNSRIYFELSNPSLQDLQRTAHRLASQWPDRAFSYGYDDDNDPYIDVRPRL